MRSHSFFTLMSRPRPTSKRPQELQFVLPFEQDLLADDPITGNHKGKRQRKGHQTRARTKKQEGHRRPLGPGGTQMVIGNLPLTSKPVVQGIHGNHVPQLTPQDGIISKQV